MNIKQNLSKRTLKILADIRDHAGREYQSKLFLVGGIVRDAVLGLPDSQDIDLVLVGGELKDLINKLDGISRCRPRTSRYGTAIFNIKGTKVEIVEARTEFYTPGSRKPKVEKGTLESDILRRDFTVNTLAASIYDLGILDITGQGLEDLKNRVIQTPTDPDVTFFDDPLRMLRAIRFATKLRSVISTETFLAMKRNSYRLAIVSRERVRDELLKMLVLKPMPAINLMMSTGLIDQTPLRVLRAGCDMEQGRYHRYDVLTHSVSAADNVIKLAEGDPSIELLLSALLHDIGKPFVRTQDPEDSTHYHFYGHEEVSARLAYDIMHEMRLSGRETSKVLKLIANHMRVPNLEWGAKAFRLLDREIGSDLDDLFLLMKADSMASAEDTFDIEWADRSMAKATASKPQSPLNGKEIMTILKLDPGPTVGEAKAFLEDLVVSGTLAADNKDGAVRALASFKPAA